MKQGKKKEKEKKVSRKVKRTGPNVPCLLLAGTPSLRLCGTGHR